MSEPTIKFRTTAIMETDLEYYFELTQDEVDEALYQYGTLEEFVKQNVDGGSFTDTECGDWIWGSVEETEDE